MTGKASYKNRMKLYDDFYTNYVPGDSEFASMPQLILVCEDEKHMAETFRYLTINNIDIKEIKYYYTTDLRQNEESLENSLAEFKLDETTNKYKLENVDIKLLA